MRMMKGSTLLTVAAGAFAFGFISEWRPNAEAALPHPSPVEIVPTSIRLQHARELLGHSYFSSNVPLSESGANIEALVYSQFREGLNEKWKPYAKLLTMTLLTESRKHQMDPVFVLAIIKQESRFNPEARGIHGEVGLMQIRPETAKWLLESEGSASQDFKELDNPVVNIRIGMNFLSSLRQQFRQQAAHYISAYNMGAGNVRKHLKNNVVPKLYHSKVMNHYHKIYSELLLQTVFNDQRLVASAANGSRFSGRQ